MKTGLKNFHLEFTIPYFLFFSFFSCKKPTFLSTRDYDPFRLPGKGILVIFFMLSSFYSRIPREKKTPRAFAISKHAKQSGMQIEYLHSDHEFYKMTCFKAFGIRRVSEMLYSLISTFININIYGTCYRCENITPNKFE